MPAAASRHQPRARSDRHRRVPAARLRARAAHAVPRRAPRRGGNVRSLSSSGERDAFATGIRRRSASNASPPRDAIDETQRLVERAVEKQVMSDVPVGVFTSGGLDSSILATLAAKFIGVDQACTRTRRHSRSSRTTRVRCAEELAKRIRTRYVPVRTDEETLIEALQRVVQRRRRAARRSRHPADVPPRPRRAAARESDPQRRRRRRAVRRLSDLPRTQDRADVRRAAVVRPRDASQQRFSACRHRRRK